MHFLQALFLWSFVSTLMIGGALGFRRLFPDESPWFGFIIPPLIFVGVLNFIEHFIALPNLLWLLPLLIVFLGWLAVSPRYSRQELLFPAFIFLGSFAFTFGIRCLQSDILPSSDGLSDLNKINNYCQGDTLPPIDCWMPPFHYVWYYSLQHYAASLIKRLFDVKIGVAYNTAHALLSALTCVAGAGAAWRLSGGRKWVVILIPFIVESAATGSTAYIRLFVHNPSSWLADNLSGGVLSPPDGNILWKWLALDPYRERLELQVPGFWTWRDEYHANMAGHFLVLCGVLVVAELILSRPTLWPWLMALLLPILAVIASTWAYPLLLLLCVGTLAIALYCGCRPASWTWAIGLLGASLIILWPSFYDVTSSPQVPDIFWTKPEQQVAWREFIVQWWPIIILWIYGIFQFRALNPAVRWVILVIPLMLLGVELITVEGRYNTVEKMWGYTYGVGMIALFPIAAARVGWAELFAPTPSGESFSDIVRRRLRPASLAARMIVVVILFSAAVSLFGWMNSIWEPFNSRAFHLEGNNYLTVDPQKKMMLQVLTQTHRTTYLSGRCIWCYNESPALAVFTGNRSFIAWTYFESVADYPEEAQRREALNNAFYDGKIADPLGFLKANKISGVLIWPDDNLSNDFLANLKTQLGPAFEYIDCKGGGANNAGVFLERPMPELPPPSRG